jgi:hypothetical protein
MRRTLLAVTMAVTLALSGRGLAIDQVLNASDFIGKSGAQAEAFLKKNAKVSQVHFDKNESGYMFQTASGTGIVIVYKGRAIAAQVEVPETDSSGALLIALGVADPGRPTFDQHQMNLPLWIMHWDANVKPFQRAWVWRGRGANGVTTIGVTWDKAAHERWESFR